MFVIALQSLYSECERICNDTTRKAELPLLVLGPPSGLISQVRSFPNDRGYFETRI